uniref:DUF5641 domain-containing protein n=1 Tax=Ascaris lumbricoides TaxID=6252 RepID=A0A0M3IG74_ASCLU
MSLRKRYRTEQQQHCRVMVAEESLPRAEWKLCKIEKVDMDSNGKQKPTDVRMPNDHVLKRRVNMLHSLKVSEEGKEAQATSKGKEFVKHLADKNLQGEETEEEKESLSKCKTTRKTPARTINDAGGASFTSILASSVSAKPLFHVCAKYGHGLYVKMTDKLNCKEVRGEMHSSSPIVKVLSRAFISANATFCAKVTRTVCSKCFLRWSLAVTRDETTLHSMTPSQCLEMQRSLQISSIRLEQSAQPDGRPNSRLNIATAGSERDAVRPLTIVWNKE